MRRPILIIIICLFATGIITAVFLFSGMLPLPGQPGELPLGTRLVSPAPLAPPASTSGATPAPSASPAEVPPETTDPGSVRAERSTTLSFGIANPSGSIVRDPYEISAGDLEQRVHELINQQRTGMGLSALGFDPVLADIARRHSEDMADQNYFAHVNPAGQNPTARGTAAGYSCRKNYGSYYTFGIAENLFQNNLYSSATFYSNRETEYDWNSPEEIAQITITGWMDSSGHRENILTSTFDREGIGVAFAKDGKVYITEDFC